MFSMLSGNTSARADEAAAGGVAAPWAPPPAGPPRAAGILDDDGLVVDTDENPLVEVGGPSGPVFSAGPAVMKLPTPKPADAPKPAADPLPFSRAAAAPPQPQPPAAARTYPRLAGAPAYLSVRFQNLSERLKAKGDAEGPDPSLVALHFPDHPVSGEYRTLRDEVREQLPEPTPRVLMFTAATGEAGTTTVLTNLAVTIAREGAPRVLVIDANVTRPAAAARFALKPAPGLVEVLAQQVPLAWAVQPTAVPNLQILPAGGDPAAPHAAVGRDLPKLLDQVRQWYDWVLIDAGVWGVIPDRDAACPSADAVYLVTREGDVDRSEFAGLRGWVRELGGLLRGYVATRG